MKWFQWKITRISCLWAAAECTAQSCSWVDRWQLLHLAAGRPFCTLDRWRYSSYFVPFPVDDRKKRKLMIPVRNNTFELTVINETTPIFRIPSSSGHKMCADREAKAVCAGHCWMHQNRRSKWSSLCSPNQQPFYSYCYSPFSEVKTTFLEMMDYLLLSRVKTYATLVWLSDETRKQTKNSSASFWCIFHLTSRWQC